MKLFILCNVDTLKKPVVIVDVVLSVAKIATFSSPVFALHGWVHSSKAPLPCTPLFCFPWLGATELSCRDGAGDRWRAGDPSRVGFVLLVLA